MSNGYSDQIFLFCSSHNSSKRGMGGGWGWGGNQISEDLLKGPMTRDHKLNLGLMQKRSNQSRVHNLPIRTGINTG